MKPCSRIRNFNSVEDNPKLVFRGSRTPSDGTTTLQTSDMTDYFAATFVTDALNN